MTARPESRIEKPLPTAATKMVTIVITTVAETSSKLVKSAIVNIWRSSTAAIAVMTRSSPNSALTDKTAIRIIRAIIARTASWKEFFVSILF